MTVSRSLSNPELVHPETLAKVLEAVHILGYVPNAAARSLVQGRTSITALVVSDIRNPFFTDLARGVEDVAHRYGYTLMLGNTDESATKERRYLETLYAQRIAGIILATTDPEHVRLMQNRDIPLVLVDRTIAGERVDSVVSDAYDGGRKVIAHLLAQGYTNITFVGGPRGNSTLEARLAGCGDAMQDAGLPLVARPGRLDQASGEEIAAAIVAEQRIPSAIVAANNLVAVGVIVELRRHGVRVPDDVGLACFGELELASQLDPFLTTIREPAYETGRLAMEMLHERISGARVPPRQITLPVQLVVRRSTHGSARLQREPAATQLTTGVER
ncbi:MAG: LacI family DNA-binding transcriptional regulator [Gemmatimonadaceae bacterium]